MKTQDEIIAYLKAHPNRTDQAIRSNIAISAAQLHAARAAMNGTAAPIPRALGRSLNVLLDQFDDVKKVKRAMKALSRDAYLEDDEMRRSLAIASPRWREVAQHHEIARFCIELPNRRKVWMHPEAQAKLTAAINLAEAS